MKKQKQKKKFRLPSKSFIITILICIAIILAWAIFTHPSYMYDNQIGNVYQMRLNLNTGKLTVHCTSTYDISEDGGEEDTQTVEEDNVATLSTNEMILFRKAKAKDKEQALEGLAMFLQPDAIAADEDNTTYRELANDLWNSILSAEPYVEDEDSATMDEDFQRATDHVNQMYDEYMEYIEEYKQNLEKQQSNQ